MQPTNFPESNFTFTKPESMTDEQCGDLPVFTWTDQDGIPHLISCWQLSESDLANVNETGVVWLDVIANRQPPVSIFTENPFQP